MKPPTVPPVRSADPKQRHGDHDRGVATVVAAMISLALLTVLWLGVELGSAVISRHRAEGAADLAALAAAASASQGAERACARAERVARGMRSVVLECRLDGWEARVEVRTAAKGRAFPFLAANARARAGPAA